MSTGFAWDDFEVHKPEEGFDWNQFEVSDKKKSPLPEMKRDVGRKAKVIGSTLAGTFGDIADLPHQLAKKAFGDKVSDKSVNLLKSVLHGGNIPTSGKITEEVEKVAPSLAPQSEAEKEEDENLALLTSLLVPTPGGKAKVLNPANASKIYRAGRLLGLTAEQLTPLMQGEKKLGFLGKFAKQGPKLRKTFEETENVLSNVYTGLKESSKKSGPISKSIEQNLAKRFDSIKEGMGKTLHPSPDKQMAMNFIEGASARLKKGKVTSEELMNFYQDINSAVNWNAIRNGKKALSELKSPVLDALHKANPELAQKFRNTNELYATLQKTKKQIGMPKIEKYLSLGKIPAALAGIVFGHVGTLKTVAAHEVLQRVSTKMLTDPKWQNLHQKGIHAVKIGSKKAGMAVFQEMKNKLRKEDPDLYKEIDWDAFQTEDSSSEG